MLKITLKSPGNFEFDDVPEPTAGEGEAVVEVKSMGICAGDVCAYLGKKLDIFPLPYVPCHEFGGIVSEIRDETGNIKEGDKVAVSPHISCGNCFYCKMGLELTCDNDKIYGMNLEGGFVEKIAVPVKNIVKFDDDFDIRYLSLVEPTTVAYNLVKDARDSVVMVIGTGAIGMTAVAIAKNCNNRIIAVDIDDNHLEIARKLGADLALNPRDRDKDKKIEEMFGKERVDYVGMTYVDQELLDWSVDVVRRCSTISFIDVVKTPIFKVDLRKIWHKIITFRGLDSLYLRDFIKAADIVKNGIVDPNYIVSNIFPMRDVKKAYDYKIEKNALKVILTN